MLLQEQAYITPDDFFNMYGVDLREVLRSDDNESNQPERFIAMVTSHLKNWVDSNTFRRLDYSCLTKYQYRQWQRAILAQCYYTYKEGAKALGLSSGVDDEKGIILDYGTLREVEICPSAIDCLSTAGLFNLVMQNRPRNLQNNAAYGFDDTSLSPSSPCPQPAPGPTPTYIISGVGYTEED